MNLKSANIDLTYLQHTCAGNESLMTQIIELFLSKTVPRLAELQMNIERENWEEVRVGAHKIKTSYNSIGAKEVGGMLECIELDAKAGSTPVKAEMLKQFETVHAISNEIFKEIEQTLLELKD